MSSLRTRLTRLEQSVRSEPETEAHRRNIANVQLLMADPVAYGKALQLAERVHARRATESDEAILASDPEIMGLAVAFAERVALRDSAEKKA